MKVRAEIFFVFLFLSAFVYGQKTSKFIDSLLKAGLPKYSNVLTNHTKYKLQVIYTQITRDKDNKPSFKNYYWRADTSQFYYPASLVKLPVSIMALEKVNELSKYNIDRNTTMITDSVFFCQKKVYKDTTSETRFPSVAQYIKKMFLVSDNFSFAREYEFLGCDYIHKRLEDWGFQNIRIVNRLDAQCKGDTGKITSPVFFLSANGDTLYKQPMLYPAYAKEHPLPRAQAGVAHINDAGRREYTPKDFSKHNFMSLQNCHEIFKRLVFWNYMEEKVKYRFTKDDWSFAMKYLGMYPKESDYPKYVDKKIFYDSFKKYFIYGSAVPEIRSDSLREFNIVGRAYGFLSDVAYIVDYKNKVEFLLSATIYVSERNIVGNGKYEYDQIGLPFFKDLSLLLYNTEKSRSKKFEPDLKEFEFFRK
ncbi:MAG: serine hydrolase [Bacteroidia bacterium]